MPHLMRHPVSVLLDSCFRRKDNHSKGIYDAVRYVEIPNDLVSVVRELIAKHQTQGEYLHQANGT